MSTALRRRVRRAYGHLRAALRAWAGDDEYERHVRQCAKEHRPPLERGQYFAQRLEERYRTTERCC